MDKSSNSKHLKLVLPQYRLLGPSPEHPKMLRMLWRLLEHQAHLVLLFVADVPLALHISQIVRYIRYVVIFVSVCRIARYVIIFVSVCRIARYVIICVGMCRIVRYVVIWVSVCRIARYVSICLGSENICIYPSKYLVYASMQIVGKPDTAPVMWNRRAALYSFLSLYDKWLPCPRVIHAPDNVVLAQPRSVCFFRRETRERQMLH